MLNIVLSIILLAGCGEVTTVTDSIEITTPTASTVAVAPAIAEIRTLAFAYWEAFNGYDADLALSYLEDAYRSQRDEPVRAEIGSISAFGIQLGVQEEGPPRVLEDGTAEFFIELREPLGTRRIKMAFAGFGGEWKIIFAEEVD